MHIPPHENNNDPIVGTDDANVPLAYFNIVKLNKDETFLSAVPGYETCLVPAHGTIDVTVGREGGQSVSFDAVGERASVWDKEPSAVYVPVGSSARFVCRSASAEIFVAGARFDEAFEPFVVRPAHIDPVQYGSDDTKTHRKIKHILGQKPPGKVGRLLVSETLHRGRGRLVRLPTPQARQRSLPE